MRSACRARQGTGRWLIGWSVIDRSALGEFAEKKPGLGFWKLFRRLRQLGHEWNHKRVYRVYCLLKLNRRRRPKRRVAQRDPMPLFVSDKLNQVWSADFMSDALYNGVRLRTCNVIDDFNREVLRIEIDTSLPSRRLVRVLEQLERGLPDVLRTDNGHDRLDRAGQAESERVHRTLQSDIPPRSVRHVAVQKSRRGARADLGMDARIQRRTRPRQSWWVNACRGITKRRILYL